MHTLASQRQRGYTLLEILVVILLIGLVASLVLPNLNKLYERGLAAYERNNLLRSLSAVSYLVYRQKKTTQLGTRPSSAETTPEPSLIELPQGWEIAAEEPIVYLDNGVCLGGELTLIHGSLSRHYRLIPPYCQAVPIAKAH